MAHAVRASNHAWNSTDGAMEVLKDFEQVANFFSVGGVYLAQFEEFLLSDEPDIGAELKLIEIQIHNLSEDVKSYFK